jgi:DNA segregation ATPase FtsK/SpoIIIE, S-DNA-T family
VSQRAKKSQKVDESALAMKRRLSEALFLLILVAAVYLLLSLLSHDPSDPGWSRAAVDSEIDNLGGAFGAWLADLFLVLFGYMAYAAPLLIGFAGFRVLSERGEPAGLPEWSLRSAGLLLAVMTGCMLLAMQSPDSGAHPGGGIIGDVLSAPMAETLGVTGAVLVSLSIFLGGITLFTGLSWIDVTDRTGRFVLAAFAWTAGKAAAGRDWFAGRRARAERDELRKRDSIKRKSRKEVRIEPRVEPEASKPAEKKARQQPLFKNLSPGELPPLELLDEAPASRAGFSEDALKAMSRQVELKLADFGVEVEVVAVHPGPVITRFELQPAPGVRGSQISSLDKDIARGLSVISVRVVDVIPGKSVVGLEIPNAHREIVFLREILESREYDKTNSPLALALGKDIGGRPMVVDIARMPHLLVAGTTGSGKSVASTR